MIKQQGDEDIEQENYLELKPNDVSRIFSHFAQILDATLSVQAVSQQCYSNLCEHVLSFL